MDFLFAHGPIRFRHVLTAACIAATAGLASHSALAAPVPIDLSGYHSDCGVRVKPLTGAQSALLEVEWPMGGGESGRLLLDTRPGKPLFASLGITDGVVTGKESTLLRDVDPVTFITVGSRQNPPGRPPGMSVFNVFFDSPAQRPFQTHRATLDLKRVRVASEGHRASIVVNDLSAGSFTGSLQVSIYRGSRLVHVEAVLRTDEEARAYLYDAGLASSAPTWKRLAWIDTEGHRQSLDTGPRSADRAIAVRHRTIVAESDAGTVASFPPPHQFFFPRDLTDNLQNVWAGRNHRGLDDRPGFGVRQSEKGGGAYVPWFNAPPGTDQRLGVFYLLSRGNADEALRETLRYTHGDRFPQLPGHATFTSHWHMAIAVAAMQEQARGGGRTIPDFVRMFKDLGVNLVHLAEFHGDGHQADPGPLRLPELEAMFAECRRLSDSQLVFLPGEEINTFLGIARPGQHPGHWMSLFPRPVYWTLKREPGAPFVEQDPRFGTVYRVGSREDMVRLLEQEHGLVWSAHPRIKASNWAPDAFRNEDYFKADFWLGGAWKAMPADLSSPRLGRRSLDLLDDMANWGHKKYVPGEVDVFKIDHTHELYGHMNVNYLRLDRVPRFEESWQPVLDALRAGRFFVTTGEVLLHSFQVGGKSSGETLSLSTTEPPEVRLTLEWTFPLRFAEIVSGDGTHVFRQRIDLADTESFGRHTWTLHPDLAGRRWIRVEAWDIAANGTFSQPVWIEKPLP